MSTKSKRSIAKGDSESNGHDDALPKSTPTQPEVRPDANVRAIPPPRRTRRTPKRQAPIEDAETPPASVKRKRGRPYGSIRSSASHEQSGVGRAQMTTQGTEKSSGTSRKKRMADVTSLGGLPPRSRARTTGGIKESS